MICKAMIRPPWNTSVLNFHCIGFLICCKWSEIIYCLINRTAMVCFPLFARLVYSLAGINIKKMWSANIQTQLWVISCHLFLHSSSKGNSLFVKEKMWGMLQTNQTVCWPAISGSDTSTTLTTWDRWGLREPLVYKTKCGILFHHFLFFPLCQALMSLFVLASKDGWVDIMYDGLDAVGVDQQVNINSYHTLTNKTPTPKVNPISQTNVVCESISTENDYLSPNIANDPQYFLSSSQ